MANRMANTCTQNRLLHIENMEYYKEMVIDEIKRLERKVHHYFINELRADVDEEWARLESQYFEDHVPADQFFVPIRRKISPDWLQGHANGRLAVPDLDTNVRWKLYSKYTIFLPDNKNYSPLVHGVRNGTWERGKLTSMIHPSLRNIRKRVLWARIQHLKRYLKDTVPGYDDLLLKYDEDENPVLHPLYNLDQAYDDTSEYTDSYFCDIDDISEPESYTQYIHGIQNREVNRKMDSMQDLSAVNSKSLQGTCEEALPSSY